MLIVNDVLESFALTREVILCFINRLLILVVRLIVLPKTEEIYFLFHFLMIFTVNEYQINVYESNNHFAYLLYYGILCIYIFSDSPYMKHRRKLPQFRIETLEVQRG